MDREAQPPKGTFKGPGSNIYIHQRKPLTTFGPEVQHSIQQKNKKPKIHQREPLGSSNIILFLNAFKGSLCVVAKPKGTFKVATTKGTFKVKKYKFLFFYFFLWTWIQYLLSCFVTPRLSIST